MHCNDWDLPPLFIWGADGVPPRNFGPGFREYADNHGYDDFVTDWCLNRGYDKIQDEIYACRPMGVMFSYNLYYTNWHWCCVKGFDTRGAVDYIIMNDPQGFESTQNWASVKESSVITRIWRD